MRQIIKWWAFLMLILSVGSCVETIDTKEGNNTTTSGNENPLPEVKSSVDFNWELYTTCNLTIKTTSEDDPLEKYFAEVYIVNPDVSDVTPVAVGYYSSNTPLEVKVSYPTKTKNIYVKKIDPERHSIIFGYELPTDENSSLEIELGLPKSTASYAAKKTRSTTGDVTFTISEKPENYTDKQNVVQLPSSYTTITSTSQRIGKGAYLIPAGTTLPNASLNLSNDVINSKNERILYIQGEVKSLNNLQNITLVFLPGSSISTVSNEVADLRFISNNCALYIAQGAEIHLNKIESNVPLEINIFGDLILEDEADISTTGSLFIDEGGKLTALGTNGAIASLDQIFVAGELECKSIHQNSNYSNNQYFTVSSTGVAKIENILNIESHELNVANELYCDQLICGTGAKLFLTGNLFVDTKIDGGNGLRYVTMRNASITSSAYSDQTKNQRLPVPFINFSSSPNDVFLVNGSMILAEKMQTAAYTRFYASNLVGNDETSLVSCKSMYDYSPYYISGGYVAYNNMIVEYDTIVPLYYYPYYNYGVVRFWAGYAKYNQSPIVVYTHNDVNHNGNPEPTPIIPTETEIVIAKEFSICTEDLWPYFGDFDINDIVVHVDSIKAIVNENNKITSMTFKASLSAVGGTRKMGMGLQLDNIPANNVNTVTYSSMNRTGFSSSDFTLTASGINQNQEKAVVNFFGDSHAFMLGHTIQDPSNRTMINTYSKTVEEVPFSITISFNTPVEQSDLNLATFNFFSYMSNNTSRRIEIHAKGYQPTDIADTQYFDKANDRSYKLNIYYAGENGIPFMLLVPDANGHAWEFPKERKRLNNQRFLNWANSNGQEDTDWYTYEEE